ncbi:MAG: leucyl/phenylalanyl-tRNA--protein transferase, partial [Planctomycetota bacterium]
VALIHLARHLTARGYDLLDVQFLTPHLARFGAVEIPREVYLERVRRSRDVDVSFGDPTGG